MYDFAHPIQDALEGITHSLCSLEYENPVSYTHLIMFSVHGSLCSWPILEFGTEEQKQKYLVPLAQGEKLGAMGLTEPGAGTDANGVRTTCLLYTSGCAIRAR